MNPAAKLVWGQPARITCSSTTQLLDGTFLLQKTLGQFKMTQPSGPYSVTFNILKVTFDHHGEFQCQFEKFISGQKFTSPFSDSVRLTVSLPKPSISVNPTVDLTWGQQASITCSIAATPLSGTFILQKAPGPFRMTQASDSSSATFNIPKVNLDHHGEFQCQYEKKMQSQTFTSPLTNAVHLTVSLERPNISVTSPNAGLIWAPGGAEVTRGYSFFFTCSINPNYPQGNFSLIFSGSNITETRPAVNNSASFNFPAAEFEHQGNYSCVYDVMVYTQRFCSAEALPISLVIKSSLLLMVLSASSGILLLVLLVFLAVCLGCRKRLCAKQVKASEQNRVTFQQLNKEDNECDCDDYENVDVVRLAMKMESTVDDNIYEEAGHNLRQTCVNIEDKEAVKQYEEDMGSTDEDDYVNVAAPWKENVMQHEKWETEYQ